MLQWVTGARAEQTKSAGGGLGQLKGLVHRGFGALKAEGAGSGSVLMRCTGEVGAHKVCTQGQFSPGVMRHVSLAKHFLYPPPSSHIHTAITCP